MSGRARRGRLGKGLRAFRRLPPAKRRLAVEAALALLLAFSLARLAPARWWLPLLRTEDVDEAQPEGGGVAPSERRTVGRAVERVAWHLPFRARCLPQAMAAQWMLRRRGERSTLVLGARRGGGATEFHAWLLAGGELIVGGEESASYTAFPGFDARRRAGVTRPQLRQVQRRPSQARPAPPGIRKGR